MKINHINRGKVQVQLTHAQKERTGVPWDTHSLVSVSKLKQFGFGEMETEWATDGNGNALWPELVATESELENIWARLDNAI